MAQPRFSWAVFALVNVLIDLEPIGFLLITLSPEHHFFHTIIGALIGAWSHFLLHSFMHDDMKPLNGISRTDHLPTANKCIW